MIIVIVQHFLDKKGKNYFSTWVDEARSVLNKWDGFVSLDLIRNIDEEETSCLLLKFQALNKLRQWSQSGDHSRILEKLSLYRLKKQVSTVYELDDTE